MDGVGNVMPEIGSLCGPARETLTNANAFISALNGILGRSITTIEEVGRNVSSMSASALNIAKFGAWITGLKYFFDSGVSLYQTVKLTGIASETRNDLKKLINNTSKTEDEIVTILRNTGSDLKSSTTRLTEDIHKMGQDLGRMVELLSQSSHVSSKSIAHISQDLHQTSRYFMVTCFSLTTAALAASMIYLQNSSCYDDQKSMLCIAPLKSMAAATIAVGFVVLRMLMPNRVQHKINDNFLIPKEGIDQNVEWTEEQLDSIKAINFDVFNLIEAKRQLGSKWGKQELEWLLSQDKNIFLKVILSDCLDNNN